MWRTAPLHCRLVWVPERTVETTMRAKHNDTRSCRPVLLCNAMLDVVDDDAQSLSGSQWLGRTLHDGDDARRGAVRCLGLQHKTTNDTQRKTARNHLRTARRPDGVPRPRTRRQVMPVVKQKLRVRQTEASGRWSNCDGDPHFRDVGCAFVCMGWIDRC